MQIQNAIITGSFSYNGADLSNVTSSNAYSASLSSRTTNLESTSSVLVGASSSFSSILTSVSSSQQQLSSSFLTLTASFNAVSASQQQISASYIALSASYNTFSGSASTRITVDSASLLQVSASYIALSGSYNTYSSSVSTRTTQIETVYATTGSNSFRANQSITGSLVVSSTITAQTLIVQTVTSSIVYSSGSNIFGCDLNSRQTFTGSVLITGSLTIAGASSATSYSGTTIFGSTIACSPIGCFATSCATVALFTGCVGIGSVSPDAALHICCSAGSANALLAHFQNSGGGTAIATIKIGEGSPEGQYGVLGHYGVDNSFRIGSVNGNLSFHAGASTACGTNLYGMCERLTILTSGNVGIGRTDPTRLLDVSALGTAYIRASDRTNSVNVDMLAASSGGWIGTQTTHAFMIQTDNTERMRITSGGNVGIGVTPSAWDTLTPLQIKNVAFAGYTSGNTHVLYAASNFYYCGGDKYITNGFASLYSQADGNHVWYNASCNCSGAGAALTFVERMRITCGGKVGIGCTTPQKNLTVDGCIGMSNTYNWAITNDNDTNWGFRVCSTGANYSTFLSYAGDAGSDRRGGIYNQNGHWVAYGNCQGHFVVQCNLTVGCSIVSSAGNFGSEKTVTISALCTSVLIFSGAPSGIISARDNTNGGSGIWLHDPNGGSTLIAQNWINGVYTVFYSGGNTYVQKTSGNVPIAFHYVIYGN